MMNIFRSKTSGNHDSVVNGRRSFIWKLAAGVSTTLATTAGMAKTGVNTNHSADNPTLRTALLEEEKTLRKFHQSFEQAMNETRHDDIIGMFAEDAEVVFNGETFKQRNQEVSRLYREHFASSKTGKNMEQAPGFELTADQQQDNVLVYQDCLSAEATFPYSIQVGSPIELDTSLAAMARLQGEGVQTWWEGGVYKIAYRKDGAGGWKVSRLEYDTLSRADYRPGRSYARAIPASNGSVQLNTPS
jgi:SnoaL-like domain